MENKSSVAQDMHMYMYIDWFSNHCGHIHHITHYIMDTYLKFIEWL